VGGVVSVGDLDGDVGTTNNAFVFDIRIVAEVCAVPMLILVKEVQKANAFPPLIVIFRA